MATLNQEGGGVEDGGCGEKKGVLFRLRKDSISRLLGNGVREACRKYYLSAMTRYGYIQPVIKRVETCGSMECVEIRSATMRLTGTRMQSF